jgi:ribose transport system permease protein
MNARVRDFLRTDWLSLLIVVALASVLLAVAESSFTQQFNLYVVIYNITITSLFVLGQMVVVATGGMNIALGAMGGLAAVMAAGLMESYGVPLPAVIVIGLGAGALMGFANGFLTVKTGINPFIITLAMASAYEGANLGITSANPYYNISTDWTAYGQARTALLPHPTLVMVAVAIILAVLFYRTVLGRSILAVGGNARSAELAGIPVGRVIIIAHVLSGLIAALAGLLLMARLGNGTPTIGSDWLLPSFAAVIIGGTALEGGAVSILGAILATALLAIIENALVIRQADPFWVTFLEGALILAAVFLNRLRSAGGLRLSRAPRHVAGPGAAAASKS